MKRLLRICLVFLFIAAAQTLITLARPLLGGEEIGPERVLLSAAAGLVGAAVLFAVVRWQQARESRKPTGFPTTTRFRTAVSRGRLPAEADREQWQRELSKTIRVERPFIWIGPLMFRGFAVVGVFMVAADTGHRGSGCFA